MSTVSIPDQCRSQALWCEKLGSPLYHYLLNRAADDYEDGGPVQALLAPHQHEPRGSALPLRMMGAVHRLALTGEGPELARFSPSCGGRVELEPAWLAFRNVLAQKSSELQQLIRQPVQTNEVGRCGALLGGFFLIARHTGAASSNTRDRSERRPESPLGPLLLHLAWRSMGKSRLAGGAPRCFYQRSRT